MSMRLALALLCVCSAASAREPRPDERLTLDQARQYLLVLVNRDRANAHLPPVILDEGPAQRAGQLHAEDMARSGYVGHWGTDGSVPEQRYTEAGGTDVVMENASCIADGRARPLDAHPLFLAGDIAATEASFINERPPLDGHRKNILNRAHTRLGIGLAQPRSSLIEIDPPCMSQEFVDSYGTYQPLPTQARVGQRLHVQGETKAPASPIGIGLARIDAPRPIAVTELLRRYSYPIPAAEVMYWRAGYTTPIPVAVDGNRFQIDLPLSLGARPGLYELSVWATLAGSNDPQLISLRTIRVER
jgi:uncharacterized protein YkwD